jgi:hypothetical protein
MAMRARLKATLLVALLSGAWLPATIVCDVPNVDVLVGYDDDDWDDFWDDFFDEVVVVDRHAYRYDYRYDCCDGWFCFDWFDCW